MFQEHAMQRALSSFAEQVHNNSSVVSTVVNVISLSSLNLLPIIG